ncbi:hypothetical protein BZA05DRAFT_92966 [Tricharina praecox]|uniref:uncharacterized protein n=1 Tax=Tricharina praecox TaxID=43433 RepID=UPI00221EA8C0|nr:uncharacterized protein BZA05DRAFT_92966 [Tricharina praecox]KAI5848252.1 hypothetical protein BZA05DRAFT_92966 [Tricharina praecox]
MRVYVCMYAYSALHSPLPTLRSPLSTLHLHTERHTSHHITSHHITSHHRVYVFQYSRIQLSRAGLPEAKRKANAMRLQEGSCCCCVAVAVRAPYSTYPTIRRRGSALVAASLHAMHSSMFMYVCSCTALSVGRTVGGVGSGCIGFWRGGERAGALEEGFRSGTDWGIGALGIGVSRTLIGIPLRMARAVVYFFFSVGFLLPWVMTSPLWVEVYFLLFLF